MVNFRSYIVLYTKDIGMQSKLVVSYGDCRSCSMACGGFRFSCRRGLYITIATDKLERLQGSLF